MTPQAYLLTRIEELEKLERAATPVPWETERYDSDNGYIHFSVNDSKMRQVCFCHEDMHPKTYRKDASLIAQSRNSLPGILRALRALVESSEAISSKDKPRHETEEYWQKISHEQCATVLATDTKIARKALADAARAMGMEGEE